MSSQAKPSEIPDDVFKQNFASAIKSSKEKLELSSDEQDKFKSALDQPEFIGMLKDYMDEISDPKNREEQEAYIRQLESENKLPENMEIIQPTAGFCVKTKFKATQNTNKNNKTDDEPTKKVFINICTSPKVDKATSQGRALSNNNNPTGEQKEEEKGLHWSIPYSLGPMRHEADNKKTPQPTFDFCIHDDTLSLCRADARYQRMVVETALEAVKNGMEKILKISADFDTKNYRVLKGVKCIGGKPAIMQTRLRETTNPSVTASNANPAAQAAAALVGGIKPAATTGTGKASEDMTVIPKYHIVHRGVLDIGDFTLDGAASVRPRKRPEHIVLKIQLPLCTSAKGIDLSVSELSVVLRKTMGKTNYVLDVNLPYPVEDKKAKAKFDKDKRTLELTLPVKAPERSVVVDKPLTTTQEDEKFPENEKISEVNRTTTATTSPTTTDDTVNEVEQKELEQVSESKVDLATVTNGNKNNVDSAKQDVEPSLKTTEGESCDGVKDDVTKASDDGDNGDVSKVSDDGGNANVTEGADDGGNTDMTTVSDDGDKDDVIREIKFNDAILQAAYEASLLPLPCASDSPQTPTAAAAAAATQDKTESTDINEPISVVSGGEDDEDVANVSELDKANDASVDSNATNGGTFIESPSFTGRKQGYVFKTSKLGLGYYADSADGIAQKVGAVNKTTVKKKVTFVDESKSVGASKVMEEEKKEPELVTPAVVVKEEAKKVVAPVVPAAAQALRFQSASMFELD